MDKEPFAKWDVLSDEPPPFDVITLLQKSQFNPELIRAYAQRQRAQNLLVGELTRLLEPASEFAKLAIVNIETRNLTQAVVESWKPVVASALNEWARQRILTAVLSAPQSTTDNKETPKLETTQDELNAFESIKKILGPDCPIGYEDSVAYFKVHLAGKRTWVFVRLQLGRKTPTVWVPLPPEKTAELSGGCAVTVQSGWSVIALDAARPIADLEPLLRAAYVFVKNSRASGSTDESSVGN